MPLKKFARRVTFLRLGRAEETSGTGPAILLNDRSNTSRAVRDLMSEGSVPVTLVTVMDKVRREGSRNRGSGSVPLMPGMYEMYS